MTKKILAFGASNSKSSINKKFATYASSKIPDAEIRLVDLNDYEMPLFSVDRERENGIPQFAHDFRNLISDADAILISFAEHNGAYTVAFKNIFDWVSRIDNDVWMGKPMLLLSASPGGRGGKTVLEIAVDKFQRMNKQDIPSFSLPRFRENFSEENGILDEDLANEFQKQLDLFIGSLS